jgi:hypothetical protein
MTRGAKPLGKTAYLSTYVLPDEAARLRAYAAAVDGNTSRILRRAMLEFLDRREGRGGADTERPGLETCAPESGVPMR